MTGLWQVMAHPKANVWDWKPVRVVIHHYIRPVG